MQRKEKFEHFLESLKGNGQNALIEIVKKGFQVCMESKGINPKGTPCAYCSGGDDYNAGMCSECGKKEILLQVDEGLMTSEDADKELSKLREK